MSAISAGPLVVAAALSLTGIAMSEAFGQDGHGALALIGVEAGDAGIEVVGGAVAIDAGTFTGEMVVDRKGAAGSVSTRQSRELVLAAGEKGDIARVGVSYASGEELTVTVTLRYDGAVVSEATLETPGN